MTAFHMRPMGEQLELMREALEAKRKRQLTNALEAVQPFDMDVEPAYEPPEPMYRCPACKDLQRVAVQVGPHRYTTIWCPECAGDRAVADEARRTGIGGDLKNYTLDTFVSRHSNTYRQQVLQVALQAAQEAVDYPVGFVGWYGGVGTGKTHLLVGVCQALRELGKDVHYTSTAELLDHLKDAFDPRAEEPYSRRFDRLMSVDVLALDELDRFHATPWARTAFFRLIDHRYSRAGQCLTLWATNQRLRDREGRTLSVIGDETGYLESRLGDGRFLAVDMGQGDARASLDRGRWLKGLGRD